MRAFHDREARLARQARLNAGIVAASLYNVHAGKVVVDASAFLGEGEGATSDDGEPERMTPEEAYAMFHGWAKRHNARVATA